MAMGMLEELDAYGLIFLGSVGAILVLGIWQYILGDYTV